MKLWDLVDKRDQGIKIKGFTAQGFQGKHEPVTIIFGHIDGMYSYCWLEGEEDKLVHLSAATPIKKVSKDTYEVVDDGE